MSLIIKRATVEDAETISKIHALSWKSAYRGIVPQAYLDGIKEDLWVPAFRKWFAEGVFRADILYCNEEAVGCVTYGRGRNGRFRGWGEIVALYILPDYCGLGLGKYLLSHALNQLGLQGFGDCYLWVLAGNANARRFYEKHGFVWTGEKGEVEILGEKLVDLRYVQIRNSAHR